MGLFALMHSIAVVHKFPVMQDIAVYYGYNTELAEYFLRFFSPGEVRWMGWLNQADNKIC